MNRRSLLRGVAVAGAGGGAALAGVAVASDEATGQAALTLDVTGDSAALGADETVTALSLAVDVEWAYDVPETSSPETAVVELAAATGGDDPTVVASAESAQLFTSAEGSESFDAGLLGDVVAASELAPDAGTRETSVTAEARFRLEDSSGDVLAAATSADTATVSVERDAADPSEYGSVGGSGSLTIETGSA